MASPNFLGAIVSEAGFGVGILLDINRGQNLDLKCLERLMKVQSTRDDVIFGQSIQTSPTFIGKSWFNKSIPPEKSPHPTKPQAKTPKVMEEGRVQSAQFTTIRSCVSKERSITLGEIDLHRSTFQGKSK